MLVAVVVGLRQSVKLELVAARLVTEQTVLPHL
jgi:hypothetical protein